MCSPERFSIFYAKKTNSSPVSFLSQGGGEENDLGLGGRGGQWDALAWWFLRERFREDNRAGTGRRREHSRTVEGTAEALRLVDGNTGGVGVGDCGGGRDHAGSHSPQ